MVNKQLIWHLETTNLITTEQCGFRKNHSTIDILSTLHTDICNAKNQKQHLICISLDLEKAYDMARRTRVLKLIQNNGINGKIFLFLQNFLKTRKIQVRAHAKLSKIHQTENGLPQGSVISVTMFFWLSMIFLKIYLNLQNTYYLLTIVVSTAVGKTSKRQ